jgi:hypothetical protein
VTFRKFAGKNVKKRVSDWLILRKDLKAVHRASSEKELVAAREKIREKGLDAPTGSRKRKKLENAYLTSGFRLAMLKQAKGKKPDGDYMGKW